MSDFAKLLYDGLNTEAELVTFISQQVENLYVDFKLKRDHAQKDVDRDLQDNISKGVSGFANADGGVLVIGVDARAGQPTTIKPISPILDFEQEVNTYVPRSTAFLVPGVKVKSVPASAGGGVVLIYIPKSELAPHCSMKDKKYYQRNGDSFVAMEHYQIADSFGKRHHPHLVPYVLVKGDVNSSTQITATIGLDNHGRAVARYPYLRLVDMAGFAVNTFGVSGNGHFGLPCHPNPTNYRNYRGGADDVVHPGAPLDIARLERHFGIDTNGEIRESFQEVILSGEVVADQFSLKKWRIRMSRQQIQDALRTRMQMVPTRIDGEFL